jgi:hypothetical protein
VAGSIPVRDAISDWKSSSIRRKASRRGGYNTMADATDTDSIDEALARLEAALSRLDAVVAHRIEAAAQPDDRDAELALMDEDRARLAASRAAASARLAEVSATTGAVEPVADRAIETVQDVLARS